MGNGTLMTFFMEIDTLMPPGLYYNQKRSAEILELHIFAHATVLFHANHSKHIGIPKTIGNRKRDCA